jgi:excisionase family DNA binding protein
VETALMTIQQAAEYLQLSRETLYKYAQSSRVPAVKVGRHWRFSRSALGTWAHDAHERRTAVTEAVGDRGRLEVLVVDDEISVRRLLGAWVGQLGHNVQAAASGGEVLDLLSRRRFDVLFLDLNLADMTGAEILSRLPETDRPSVVLITGAPESRMMDEALRYPVAYALAKPFQKSDVAGVIDMIHIARGRSWQGALKSPQPPVSLTEYAGARANAKEVVT